MQVKKKKRQNWETENSTVLWEGVALLLGATVGKQADANPPSHGSNVKKLMQSLAVQRDE